MLYRVRARYQHTLPPSSAESCLSGFGSRGEDETQRRFSKAFVVAAGELPSLGRWRAGWPRTRENSQSDDYQATSYAQDAPTSTARAFVRATR